MARSVYFSFHYQDVVDFRANVVRNSGKFRKKGDVFRDASIWEEAEEKQVGKIKALIDSELVGSSVTCVLIGSETYARRWVRYEIMKSLAMKKGQVGVGINWIKDKKGDIKLFRGKNPFECLKVKISTDGKLIDFFEIKEDNWVPYRDLPQIRNTQHFKEGDFGRTIRLSEIYSRYSYKWHDGNENFPKWLEEAATKARRK